MDYFNPDYACNGSDDKGRYTYKKQPEICKWNLFKLAEALKDVVPLDETKQLLNEIYDTTFASNYYATMRKKIGITEREGYDDEELIQKLLWTMQKTACDFTNLFQLLSQLKLSEDNTEDVVTVVLQQCQDLDGVKKRARSHVNPQLEMMLKLAQVQPSLLAQMNVDVDQLQELKQAQDDRLKVLNLTPEEKQSENETLWFDWMNLYRERVLLEVEAFSDDSEELLRFETERVSAMKSVNPCMVLRNHLAQEAIQRAEEGDFTGVQELLQKLRQPFTVAGDVSADVASKSSDGMGGGCQAAPAWASDLKVT